MPARSAAWVGVGVRARFRARARVRAKVRVRRADVGRVVEEIDDVGGTADDDLGVEGPRDAVLDVLGGDRPAVLEPHPLAEGERPAQPVLRRRPQVRGEVRHELGGAPGLGRVRDQRPGVEPHQVPHARTVGALRIQAVDLRCHDPEGSAGRIGGRADAGDAGVRLDDYARRECAFYRYLDSVDAERRMMPAPKTIVLDSADPPNWILLERIDSAVGPDEEVMGADHIFELLKMLQSIPVDQLLGRRDFPLNRWDTFSYLDRVRKMYDPVLQVIGEKRWTQTSEFFDEALRWTETRQQTIVHGDFTANNILVNGDGKPYLIDFERIGIGNEDHDFAWFWIHSDRSQEWKQNLLARFFETRVGSERIRSEWGIRSAIVYLALRRLRFSLLILGDEDPNRAQNLGLLDAALMGSHDLFPV